MAMWYLVTIIAIAISLLINQKCVTTQTTPITPDFSISLNKTELESNFLKLIASKMSTRFPHSPPQRRRGRGDYKFPTMITNPYIKMDNLYEPYWKGGQWVFNRNESTMHPQGFMVNNLANTTEHPECNQICVKLYIDYGEVCGRRLNRKTWLYEYKDFKDLCHLQLENCVSATKRLGWYPLRKGPCKDVDMTTHPTAERLMVSRMVQWEERFPENVYDASMFTTTEDPYKGMFFSPHKK